MPFRCPELPHCRAHSRHPDRALSNRHRPATSEALDLMIDDSEQGSRGVRGAGPSEGRPPRPEAHTCRLSSRYILNKIIGATNPRPLLLVRRAPDPRPLNRARSSPRYLLSPACGDCGDTRSVPSVLVTAASLDRAWGRHTWEDSHGWWLRGAVRSARVRCGRSGTARTRRRARIATPWRRSARCRPRPPTREETCWGSRPIGQLPLLSRIPRPPHRVVV